MPDLNMAYPPVREELLNVLRFWLSRGVHGFRLDALPFLIHDRAENEHLEEPHAFLQALRAVVDEYCPDGVLLAEVDKPPRDTVRYYGQGDQAHMILNFYMCNHIFLALATGEARPIVRAWEELPPVPPRCNWATFLRNHDELSLSQLSEQERAQVFAAFAPDEEARVFGRGIRRRLAPMLGGDLRRLKLACSLLFTLPGAVVLNFGDELGLGEDLSLPERESVRTPMQWSAGRNAGFSDAAPERLYRPVITGGPFGYERVNVERQSADPASLLTFMRRAIRTSKSVPAFSEGDWAFLPSEEPALLAHCSTLDGESVYALHNLADRPVSVTLDLPEGLGTLLGSAEGGVDGRRVTLEPYGFRWLRREEEA